MSKASNVRFIAELDEIVRQRLEQDSEDSYTCRLARAGDARVAQKVGEEAIELLLAASGGTRDEQISEAADLLYHMLILLRCKDLSLADVSAELERRHRDQS